MIRSGQFCTSVDNGAKECTDFLHTGNLQQISHSLYRHMGVQGGQADIFYTSFPTQIKVGFRIKYWVRLSKGTFSVEHLI